VTVSAARRGFAAHQPFDLDLHRVTGPGLRIVRRPL